MKVLLVLPKRDSFAILPAPDIGVGYVARAALNAGAEVQILDAHQENIDPDKLAGYIKNKSFDLVGIKCLSIDIFKVLDYCRLIKDYDKNIITLLGGYHPTALPLEVMKSDHVDYIIRAEAELGIHSLIRNLINYNNRIPFDELSKIPNLVYRDESNQIKQNPIVFEDNLDKLGYPAWDLFNISQYPDLPGSGGRFLPIITSRGCPSNCTFCCAESIHGARIRLRSVEHVIDEVKWIIDKFDTERISIFDDNFTFYKDHVVDFCSLYKESDFGINFDISQGVRIDRIDKDMAVALKNAGCDYIGVGVESGDQGTLNIVKKGTNIADIEEKVSLIKENTSMKLMGFFIVGFPHETEANILKTINFALKLKLDYAAFTIFTPFPGTELFDNMLKEGYFSLGNFKWQDLLLDKETFKHKNISHKRLKSLQRIAYMRFYFRLPKVGFFLRVIFKEKSFTSYLKRFISILKR